MEFVRTAITTMQTTAHEHFSTVKVLFKNWHCTFIISYIILSLLKVMLARNASKGMLNEKSTDLLVKYEESKTKEICAAVRSGQGNCFNAMRRNVSKPMPCFSALNMFPCSRALFTITYKKMPVVKRFLWKFHCLHTIHVNSLQNDLDIVY